MTPVDPESLLYAYGVADNNRKDGLILIKNHRRHPRKVATNIDKTDSSCSQLLTNYLNKCIDHKLEQEENDGSNGANRGWSIYDLLTPEEKKIEYNFLVKELDKLFLRIVRLNIKQIVSDQAISSNSNPIVNVIAPQSPCKRCQLPKPQKIQTNQVQERLTQFTEAYLGILDLLTQQQKLNFNSRKLQRKQKRSTTVSIPLQDLWKLMLASAGLQSPENLSYAEILKQASMIRNVEDQQPTTTTTTTTAKPFEEKVVKLISIQPQRQFENLVEAVESFRPNHNLFIPDYEFIVENGLHYSTRTDLKPTVQQKETVKPLQKPFSYKTLNNTQIFNQNLVGDASNIQLKYVPFSY